MCPDSSSKNPCFGIAAELGHALGAVTVIDRRHILSDDRALIQVGRYIVGRRPNQLYTMRMGLMIGTRTLETGQRRVVYVYTAALQRLAQII